MNPNNPIFSQPTRRSDSSDGTLPDNLHIFRSLSNTGHVTMTCQKMDACWANEIKFSIANEVGTPLFKVEERTDRTICEFCYKGRLKMFPQDLLGSNGDKLLTFRHMLPLSTHSLLIENAATGELLGSVNPQKSCTNVNFTLCDDQQQTLLMVNNKAGCCPSCMSTLEYEIVDPLLDSEVGTIKEVYQGSAKKWSHNPDLLTMTIPTTTNSLENLLLVSCLFVIDSTKLDENRNGRCRLCCWC